jgi:phosphoribosylformylglycinamidine synthase
MSSPDMCSKRWIWEQYDRHVMADTVDESASGGDAAVVRLHGSKRALAMTSDVTPRYVEADAHEGGKQAVAEAWRNLTAVGAKPLAITDNLNFGNPERPEIMGQFVAAIEGMAEACRALEFPVISGNVSLYNETNGQAIPPTPTIGGVGIITDLSRRAAIGAMRDGDALVLIGETKGWLGQSLYLREVLGREEGAPPPVELAAEKRNGDFVRSLIEAGLVRACHDLSDGGLACAAADMALAANIGVALSYSGDLPDAAFLFGEDQGRYLIALAQDALGEPSLRAKAAGVPFTVCGTVGGAAVSFVKAGGAADSLPLAELRATYEAWLPNYIKG